jgi:hypothetical protein
MNAAASKSNSKGFFNSIGNAFKKAKNTVVGNATNNSKANNSTRKNVKPVTVPMNIPSANSQAPNSTAPMKGGVAPVGFRVPANMQQPSEEVMKWATTAGMPTPSGPQMRNVAHGGSRRRRGASYRNRRNRTRRNNVLGGRRRKSHRRSHNKRRN